MDIQLVIAFISASIALTVMPGPDNIFVLTESLTKGAKVGATIALGLVVGVLVHTSAAAAGISIILKTSEIAFSLVKYIGAAYLFYLAYMSLIEKPKTGIEVGEKSVVNYNFWKLFRRGFIMNVLNPKVSIFFIAFLPGFISKNGFNPALQMIILGVVFMIQAYVIFGSVALLAGRFSEALNKPKFWVYTKFTQVFVLAALGFLLVLTEQN